jgi:hypothetical protein
MTSHSKSPPQTRLRGGRVVRAVVAALATGTVAGASGSARADVGVRLGPSAGIELHDDADPFVGGDLRLSFPLSPLVINPTFAYFFDEKITLYQVSFNALYHLPLPTWRVDPYVGGGVNVTVFSYKENTPVVDNEGKRLGMNLIAGACLDLPLVSPFAQVTKGIGEFELLSIGGGLAIALGGDGEWTGCGRRAR